MVRTRRRGSEQVSEVDALARIRQRRTRRVPAGLEVHPGAGRGRRGGEIDPGHRRAPGGGREHGRTTAWRIVKEPPKMSPPISAGLRCTRSRAGTAWLARMRSRNPGAKRSICRTTSSVGSASEFAGTWMYAHSVCFPPGRGSRRARRAARPARRAVRRRAPGRRRSRSPTPPRGCRPRARSGRGRPPGSSTAPARPGRSRPWRRRGRSGRPGSPRRTGPARRAA